MVFLGAIAQIISSQLTLSARLFRKCPEGIVIHINPEHFTRAELRSAPLQNTISIGSLCWRLK